MGEPSLLAAKNKILKVNSSTYPGFLKHPIRSLRRCRLAVSTVPTWDPLGHTGPTTEYAKHARMIFDINSCLLLRYVSESDQSMLSENKREAWYVSSFGLERYLSF